MPGFNPKNLPIPPHALFFPVHKPVIGVQRPAITSFLVFFQISVPCTLFPVPWLAEPLHFHLLKFARAKRKRPWRNFISKCLSNLRNAKRDFHPGCLLNVRKSDINTLRGL